MIITHNMASINTNRQLGINQNNASKSLEKLSSGFRINKAGDDAAGLAISEKMRGQIRGLDQASRNSQDGISMIQTAESSLSETQNILQRMKELATQSANDTNVTTDRGEIQKEINQLSSEINRIGNTTEFNTKKLLNGGGEKTAIDPTTIINGGQAASVGAFAQVQGSVAETKGVFAISVAAGTAVNTTFTIGGQSFKVVSGVADATRGEVSFGVYGSDVEVGASLAAAINANEALHDRFDNAVVGANGVITLTERAGKAVGGNAATTLPVAGGGILETTVTTGIKEVAGKYTINLDRSFELAGDNLFINGVALTAASSNAGVNAFNISADEKKQINEIAAAINGNTAAGLGQRFEATTTGNTLVLTERAGKATGTNIAAVNISATASAAVSGVFHVGAKSLVANGGRFTVDGADIAVTNDKSDAGLANGTAMLAGSTLTEQAANLAAAINKNTALNSKYVATTATDKLVLTQKTPYDTMTAPVVSTNTSAKDTFEAKLQIGANTAQSITLTVADMRSKALAITTDDADTATVTAKNGAVASFVKSTSVSDGTSNNNTEFSLDVSTHDKATAAISVLDDAIQSVSAQRSQLGAFQNRLEHTISNLGTSSENLTAAESRVRDVDMAKEMMSFQKNNILQQAATAMMAQANQLPQGVLQLLR